MNTQRVQYHRFAGGWILILILFLAAACKEHFINLNTPSDEIVTDNIDATLLGQAFAQSQYQGMRGDAGIFQRTQSHYGDLYSQYFAQIAANFDSDQFQSLGRRPDANWNDFYENAAVQLDFVEDFTAEEGMTLMNAVAKIWKVQIYHRMTDYWGPIVYSEVGNGETSVPYDSQESIYNSFFTTLDEAVSVLEANAGGNAFGSNDLLYEGDVDKWLTFANSLRLRLAMRVSYVEPDLARTEAEKAVTDGVMMENSDNAAVFVTDNSANPYNTITSWGEFRMSSAMESVLDGFDDPRREAYFSPAADGDSDADGRPQEGMRNGLPRTQKNADLVSDYSNMSVEWLSTARPGPPIPVMRAAEVYFLRAEGALRQWAMGGTAQELYEDGIRTSMEERTSASASEIDSYINSINTPMAPGDAWNSPAMSDIPIAWDPGGDFERNLEQIITQKWLALFPDGVEAWAERRRTQYPRGYVLIESLNPDIAENEFFRRTSFVESEYQDNNAAVMDAINLLSGPDRNDTRVWWDVKPFDPNLVTN